jgi:alpha-amylase/alpha-mannosidase (GH57 family)
MEKQIDENMKKAFYDLIEENTNSKTPDYDWIIRLYSEIKHKLLYYLKKDSTTYKSIDESFDVELFSQMIRADVFSQESMLKLIENTFYWIKYLGAPYRDDGTDKAKERVLNSPFNKIISVFLKETHDCITCYDEDMIRILKTK